MIYCNLKGGLGNMLFQIATTKSMSIDKGCGFSFPNFYNHLNYLNNDDFYNPSLNHSHQYVYFIQNIDAISPPDTLKTIYFPFEFVKVELPDEDVFIDGFFQSEKYFKHNRDEVLKMLDLHHQSKEYIKLGYSHLFNSRTTSIHVRRGDYVNHPNHHPVQSIDYYLEAIELLNDKTDNFIVFSDDITWCKDNLKGDNFIYIENENDYIEMNLMALCNNNIIANSSFSWWGAWLNKNDSKIVIAPKKWFGPAIQHNTNDIIPEDWIKI